MPKLQLQHDYAAIKNGGAIPAPDHPPPAPSQVPPGNYCAYNQTRGRFLAVHAEAADFSVSILDSRLSVLAPDSGSGLLIVPFRGISPTSVRVPIDLVYISHRNVVLATVESFPLSPLPPSGGPAGAVLALPAHTTSATGTLPGDRLIICSPVEIERRLHLLQEAKDLESAVTPLPDPAIDLPSSDAVAPAPSAPARPEPSAPAAAVAQPAPPPVEPPPAEPPVAPPPQGAQWKNRQPKSLMQRVFNLEPPDPRKAEREAYPGLVAYFFTGGTPVPHRIRDISRTGFYIYTGERWYLGTVIRITLTDKSQSTREFSLTVDAKVVRWGNDGVGLHFLLNDAKDRDNSPGATDANTASVSKAHIAQFIQLLKSNRA